MRLRPMTMSDADKMLEWKNYSETREFAIVSNKEVKKEDHYKWLEANLQYFQIIQATTRSLGAIRIQENEVSIWIDRSFRGLGVAASILKEISTKDMYAKIVKGNLESMRSFISAGFVPVNYINDHYYIFAKTKI